MGLKDHAQKFEIFANENSLHTASGDIYYEKTAQISK